MRRKEEQVSTSKTPAQQSWAQTSGYESCVVVLANA